jgi:hypothetical protein
LRVMTFSFVPPKSIIAIMFFELRVDG